MSVINTYILHTYMPETKAGGVITAKEADWAGGEGKGAAQGS